MASLQLDRLTDYSMPSGEQESIMDIRTERLDPIVSSAFRYVFRLDTNAYLDENSMLTFKVNATATNGGNCRLNCWNGGLGAIKRITLAVGDQVIQEVDNVNKWATLNHLYKAEPKVQNKKFAHYLHNQLKYKVRDADGGGATDTVGTIGPEDATSGFNYGASDTATGADVNSFALSETASANQRVGIPLGMLLPMLNKGRSIPLFLFTSYKVHLTIEFENDASKFVNDKSAGIAGSNRLQAAANAISISDVELAVDYLVFPSQVVNNVIAETQKEGGYLLDFMNVENIQKTIGAGTANTDQPIEHRLNLINQEVHYIQQIKQLPASKYDKILLDQRADGCSVEELQVNCNGVDVFTAGFVDNPVELYNQNTYVLGRDLQVVSPLYLNDPSACCSLISPPDQGLLGKYKPLALDMSNGEMGVRGAGKYIGQYPIRFLYKRKPVDATTTPAIDTNFVMRQDETGIMDCNYFVGATRTMKVMSMPNGSMNVIVSNL